MKYSAYADIVETNFDVSNLAAKLTLLLEIDDDEDSEYDTSTAFAIRQYKLWLSRDKKMRSITYAAYAEDVLMHSDFAHIVEIEQCELMYAQMLRAFDKHVKMARRNCAVLPVKSYQRHKNNLSFSKSRVTGARQTIEQRLQRRKIQKLKQNQSASRKLPRLDIHDAVGANGAIKAANKVANSENKAANKVANSENKAANKVANSENKAANKVANSENKAANKVENAAELEEQSGTATSGNVKGFAKANGSNDCTVTPPRKNYKRTSGGDLFLRTKMLNFDELENNALQRSKRLKTKLHGVARRSSTLKTSSQTACKHKKRLYSRLSQKKLF